MTARLNQHATGQHHSQKLTEEDVRLIRQCVAERERLREEANKLSNEALAIKFDVSLRTIDRVTQYRGWIHV